MSPYGCVRGSVWLCVGLHGCMWPVGLCLWLGVRLRVDRAVCGTADGKNWLTTSNPYTKLGCGAIRLLWRVRPFTRSSKHLQSQTLSLTLPFHPPSFGHWSVVVPVPRMGCTGALVWPNGVHTTSAKACLCSLVGRWSAKQNHTGGARRQLVSQPEPRASKHGACRPTACTLMPFEPLPVEPKYPASPLCGIFEVPSAGHAHRMRCTQPWHRVVQRALELQSVC